MAVALAWLLIREKDGLGSTVRLGWCGTMFSCVVPVGVGKVLDE